MMATTKATTLQRPLRAALIDISGTLHVGKDPIPGAIEACRKLRSYGDKLKVIYLTNTSKMSSSALLQQLRDMGFDDSAIDQQSIMTSVGATRQYLLQNGLNPLCLVEDDLLETDFHGVDVNDPNCVLVGLAPSKFNYERLNEAFRLLTKERNVVDDRLPRLVAIHRGTHYRDADHELSLGPGGFVTLLEQTAGVTAHVVGKPSSDFYHAALSSLGIEDPSQAVMVGDDVAGDVKGALDAQLGSAILVKTGKYLRGDELGQKTDGLLPTLTVSSIVEAVDFICSNLG